LKTTYIQICGGIATGKTTLANCLAATGIPAVFENFRSNPFWEAFYLDPAGNAFETEITFLLQHYHQVKTELASGSNFVCDFSFILDLAYSEVTLDDNARKVFVTVYEEALKRVPLPAPLVHLYCDVDIQLRRIRRRGRRQEQAISRDYLSELDKALEAVITYCESSVSIVRIDSGRVDFAHDFEIKRMVSEQIMAAMNTSKI
jgi:deoxyadenosine/deoxycytidine kinase